jgi:hypothetical protein
MKRRPIFISYAHADNEDSDPKKCWLKRLLEFLKALVRQEDRTIFSDRDIKIGHNWHQHIQAHLNSAKAAVLLISPAYLASDYIANNELPVLLKNASENGVKILPILIAPSLFMHAKFKYRDPKKGPQEFTLASLQAANPLSKTLLDMSEAEQDRVLLSVAEQLLEIVQENP